jgi:hypothetical protein
LEPYRRGTVVPCGVQQQFQIRRGILLPAPEGDRFGQAPCGPGTDDFLPFPLEHGPEEGKHEPGFVMHTGGAQGPSQGGVCARLPVTLAQQFHAGRVVCRAEPQKRQAVEVERTRHAIDLDLFRDAGGRREAVEDGDVL